MVSGMIPALDNRPKYNRTGIDFHRMMPRPKVKGTVIDFHCHLLAARHARVWFEAADHYGIDAFVSMTPLEEALEIQRVWGDRVQFIVTPQWDDPSPHWVDNWLRKLESFYNLGSRILKFHMAPRTMDLRHYRLDSPALRPIFREIVARKMAVMTHVGDPDTWYADRYADTDRYGSREDHYRMWESVLAEHRDLPWVGAHLGGNPENLGRLQHLLDAYPKLMLDISATRWQVREISKRRDEARDFIIRNEDRILFGSDQVSGDDRGFEFLASRFWAHRKLWETAAIMPSPIYDPDLPEDAQPMLRGLALPDQTLQKIYHNNAVRFLNALGVGGFPCFD